MPSVCSTSAWCSYLGASAVEAVAQVTLAWRLAEEVEHPVRTREASAARMIIVFFMLMKFQEFLLSMLAITCITFKIGLPLMVRRLQCQTSAKAWFQMCGKFR